MSALKIEDMSSLPFSIVDVFSTTAYKGNPLAVIKDMSASLTDTQMKLITRQFNLSETTFVNPPTVSNVAFRLRSFLPDGKEVFGAGHNSLGALWWLAKHGYLDSIANGKQSFDFNQQMGQEALPVTVTKDSDELCVTMRQESPNFYGVHDNPSGLAVTLGIDVSSIGFQVAGKKIVTPQVVSTSSSRHLLVPVANEEVLNSIRLADRERLAREIRAADPLAYGLYLFTARTDATGQGLPTFVARFFSPGMSGEDPATGSAAGPMGAYLNNYGVVELAPGEEKNVSVLQGLQVGRACLLTVTVGREQNGGTSIKLLGGGVDVISGSVVVPAPEIAF